MAGQGLHVFDRTLEKSNRWVKEIMQELHTENAGLAYTALRLVLHAIRDRIPKEEAIHLVAQLPLLIAGVFCDGWHFRPKPIKWHLPEFLAHIQQGLETQENQQDAIRITRAVMHVLERHVTEGELDEVIDSMPKDLKRWLRRTEEEAEAMFQRDARQTVGMAQGRVAGRRTTGEQRLARQSRRAPRRRQQPRLIGERSDSRRTITRARRARGRAAGGMRRAA